MLNHSSRIVVYIVLLLGMTQLKLATAQQDDSDTVDQLKRKNFYALALFEKDKDLRATFLADRRIQAVDTERREAIQKAMSGCKQDVGCELKAFLWSEDQIAVIADALRDDSKWSAPLRRASETLRRSMVYALYAQQGESAILPNAWTLCAHGMNEIIGVYGLGEKPLYPRIDSISFDVATGSYQQLFQSAVITNLELKDGVRTTFFTTSLNLGLRLLLLNHRDEASRFEPVNATLNQIAIAAFKSIDWKQFQYSAILVPGEGPDDPATSISPLGHERLALAVKAFREGKAPLIIVSGGFVHPAQTRFAEASEMKLALMKDFAISPEAILVEPFARHTTTNIRNATREVSRYSLPMEVPMLIVSDAMQIRYIDSPEFLLRCRTELGYIPFSEKKVMSDTELSVMPNTLSTQQNPLDPLDP